MHHPDPDRRWAGLTDWPPTRRPESFPGFGQPVVAPADGVVVRVSDWQRDYWSRNSWPGLLYLLVEGLLQEATGPGRILGNYIVLDLGHGVYAVLAHLRRRSVLVRPGRRVKAGQRPAECGNSGKSSEPHLHFQLMDHPARCPRSACRSASRGSRPTACRTVQFPPGASRSRWTWVGWACPDRRLGGFARRSSPARGQLVVAVYGRVRRRSRMDVPGSGQLAGRRAPRRGRDRQAGDPGVSAARPGCFPGHSASSVSEQPIVAGPRWSALRRGRDTAPAAPRPVQARPGRQGRLDLEPSGETAAATARCRAVSGAAGCTPRRARHQRRPKVPPRARRLRSSVPPLRKGSLCDPLHPRAVPAR